MVSSTWGAVKQKIMPRITIVRGGPDTMGDIKPAYCTEQLAKTLAAKAKIKSAGRCQAVNCEALLEREIDLHTEIGELAKEKEKKVSFDIILQLLRDSASLHSWEALVLYQCRWLEGQKEFEQLSQFFIIDEVYYIDVDDPNGTGPGTLESYLAEQGKLKRLAELAVADEGGTTEFDKLVEEATLPNFAVITSLSDKLASVQAAMLAKSYGTAPPVTVATLQPFMEPDASEKDPRSVCRALQKYCEKVQGKSQLVILEKYPARREDVEVFLEMFGAPKVIVNVTLQGFPEDGVKDFMEKEFEAVQTEIEEKGGTRQDKDDDYPAKLVKHDDALCEELATKCPLELLQLDWPQDEATAEDPMPAHENLAAAVRAQLQPRVHVIIAPLTDQESRVGVDWAIASAICSSKYDQKSPSVGPKRPRKYTVIDANRLVEPGGHSPAIEDRLAKALRAGSVPDNISIGLWKDLFKEAFEHSHDSMGDFLVTSYPMACSSPSASAGSLSIRDQINLLAEVSDMSVLSVQLSVDAFKGLGSLTPEDELSAYSSFDADEFDDLVTSKPVVGKTGTQKYVVPKTASHHFWRCWAQTKLQLDAKKICECTVDKKVESASEFKAKTAEEFFVYQEKRKEAATQVARDKLAEAKALADEARQAALAAAS
jgi:hypothetical protein